MSAPVPASADGFLPVCSDISNSKISQDSNGSPSHGKTGNMDNRR